MPHDASADVDDRVDLPELDARVGAARGELVLRDEDQRVDAARGVRELGGRGRLGRGQRLLRAVGDCGGR